MDDILVSVVIPVYNTDEAVLTCAVNSVTGQSYKAIELIIVDDGSNEKCSMLCDELESKDERIKVIHQKNAGVSAARNKGTEAASGAYVSYVDSDDILAQGAIEEGVNAIKQSNADFVFAAVQKVLKVSDIKTVEYHSDVYSYSGAEIDEVRKSFFTQQNPEYLNVCGYGAVNRGPVARLLKAEIARTVNFNENLVIGEDVEWNMRVLNACRTVSYVKNVWYAYRIGNSNSALHKYYGNRAELLERYHEVLYKNNKSYCDANPGDFAINMAISFYAMVEFEYLSDKCTLSLKEKRRDVQKILSRSPWNRMMDEAAWKCIPLRHRLFICSCKLGFGVDLLALREKYRSWKRNRHNAGQM